MACKVVVRKSGVCGALTLHTDELAATVIFGIQPHDSFGRCAAACEEVEYQNIFFTSY